MYAPSYPLLLTTGSMLLMSAGVMTLFGASRPIYKGFWWWTGAQWLLALGVGARLLQETAPPATGVAVLLMMQWPALVLMGLRQFYTRHPLRIPPWMDWSLLGVCYLGWLGAWLWAPTPTAMSALGACTAILHVYALVLVAQLQDFRKNTALQLLALTHLVTTAVMVYQALTVVQDEILVDTAPLQGLVCSLAAMVCALAMVYLSLVLTHDRTEMRLRFSKRRLRYLADIDTLTKIPNRRRFHELATRVLASSTPSESALMMFDIDHFKRINDLLGHAVGDEALRQVGHCTRDTLRELDVAGRLGGDEFAVLLPETTVEEAMTVASRIVTRLEHRQVAPRIARLSLSFGVVQMNDGEPIGDALRRADQALYEAKRQGRSRAVVASGDEEQPVFGTSRPLGLSTQ